VWAYTSTVVGTDVEELVVVLGSAGRLSAIVVGGAVDSVVARGWACVLESQATAAANRVPARRVVVATFQRLRR
jgi:hypothetical protein